MSKIVIALACALLLGTPTLHAQSDHAQSSKPLGIWRAALDGVPSAILTLADDSGEIGGTLVLNGLKDRTIAFTEVHTLVYPKLEGHTLTFQVRRPDAAMMTFNVAFTSATEAKLHCLNCGPDAPVAELTKDPL
jgi:hypothetical protein